MNDSRALATVAVIGDLQPIPGADQIERATVRGWHVVVRKGQLAAGQRVIYIEVDALLPISDPRFAFLAARGTKTVALRDGSGLEGHVLRTVKLRGQVSQGLVLSEHEAGINLDESPVGSDLTDSLGIVKYEPPIPAHLAGQVVGPFPAQFAPRTDAERVQNLHAHWAVLTAHPAGWIATEKVDGSSVTIVRDPADGRIRYCSRNLELRPTPELSSQIVDERIGLSAALEPGMVVQAEIAGPGIQGNPLRLPDLRLFVFNVLDAHRRFLPRSAWPQVALNHAAPLLDLPFPAGTEEAVAQVDGLRSVVGRDRAAEGVVWHTADGQGLTVLDGRDCWKAINNRYLLKHGG
ncbi:RNA ligase (ATP) [Branchiibius sp. NY16-3462-2]|uniref:RNA ligase (ATP) n=1 Tax=Branchiibius sp. NY16-3462-2 TaxID=1807500 RepID=UPI000795C36E|nr:RNA ligase (ATP) [Branchiibius sp. NY16-3462-2]KYH44798.1 hypothetical protein AZH51_12290 [Branchiibius sp. NY16-3462-2]